MSKSSQEWTLSACSTICSCCIFFLCFVNSSAMCQLLLCEYFLPYLPQALTQMSSLGAPLTLISEIVILLPQNLLSLPTWFFSSRLYLLWLSHLSCFLFPSFQTKNTEVRRSLFTSIASHSELSFSRNWYPINTNWIDFSFTVKVNALGGGNTGLTLDSSIKLPSILLSSYVNTPHTYTPTHPQPPPIHIHKCLSLFKSKTGAEDMV